MPEPLNECLGSAALATLVLLLFIVILLPISVLSRILLRSIFLFLRLLSLLLTRFSGLLARILLCGILALILYFFGHVSSPSKIARECVDWIVVCISCIQAP